MCKSQHDTITSMKGSPVTRPCSIPPLGFCPFGTKAKLKMRGVFIFPPESVIFLLLAVVCTQAPRYHFKATLTEYLIGIGSSYQQDSLPLNEGFHKAIWGEQREQRRNLQRGMLAHALYITFSYHTTVKTCASHVGTLRRNYSHPVLHAKQIVHSGTCRCVMVARRNPVISSGEEVTYSINITHIISVRVYSPKLNKQKVLRIGGLWYLSLASSCRFKMAGHHGAAPPAYPSTAKRNLTFSESQGGHDPPVIAYVWHRF